MCILSDGGAGVTAARRRRAGRDKPCPYNVVAKCCIIEKGVGNPSYPFTEAVAETVRSDYKKDLVSRLPIPLCIEAGCLLLETVGLELLKCRLGIVNFEEAAILSWITAILRQADLD